MENYEVGRMRAHCVVRSSKGRKSKLGFDGVDCVLGLQVDKLDAVRYAPAYCNFERG